MNNDEKYPLVSAIAIINDNTQLYTKPLIQSFISQSYPYKELILINNSQSQYKAANLEIDATPNVILYDTPTYVSAGMARNYGISIANGQIIAQYDIDMYHYPDRLQTQIAALAKNDCHISFLSKILSYSFCSGRASYHTNQQSLILNTMVYIRPHNIDYANVIKNEELSILEKLSQNNYKTIIIQQPNLACKMYYTREKLNFNIINNNITNQHLQQIKQTLQQYSHSDNSITNL